MGIAGLWQTVKPIAVDDDLADYSLYHAIFKFKNLFVLEPQIIGIDASIWMHECQAVFCHPHHAQMGQNPELRALFYRLAALLKLPLIPVFVFDGPNRPTQKRGRSVLSQAHWMTDRFKEFIEAFGFYHHTAPGEAEAELAVLNKNGQIDAVVTQDSDALVFGAKVVLKRISTTKSENKIKVYTSQALQDSPLAMTEGGLVLFALLCGGDYSPGISGCGLAVAIGLAQAGLGDMLLDAAKTMHGQDLTVFLKDWRDMLCHELSANSQGCLQHCYPAISKTIPESFPDINILRLYTDPVISPALSGRPGWIWRTPNFFVLGTLCEKTFSWGSTQDIVKKFTTVVWQGVCFRQLVSFACTDVTDSDDLDVPAFLFRKIRRSPQQFRFQSGLSASACNVTVYIGHLNRQLAAHLPGNFSMSDISVLPSTVSIRLPVLLAERYLPHLLRKRPTTSTASNSLPSHPTSGSGRSAADPINLAL